MRLYRAFPYDAKASPDEAGGALFRPRGGRGRIDNPDHYRTFYASSEPQGAVSEILGRFPDWSEDDLDFDLTRRHLQAYELSGSQGYYDLDDAAHLLELALRPSQVVSRDREVTQAWALRVFNRGNHDGISWWSYYKPEWRVVGLWNLAHLKPVGKPERLSLAHPAVRLAAKEIARVIR